jgi:hypothetical protein
MRQLVVTGLGLVALIAQPSCSHHPEPAGVSVEARRDVTVSVDPLGDVVAGDLEGGDRATALCFVPRAQTNAGFVGSAIKIRAGDLMGYAAVTDFPDDRADRQMMFNLDTETLRTRLPVCSR